MNQPIVTVRVKRYLFCENAWNEKEAQKGGFYSGTFYDQGHCATSRQVSGSIPDGVIGIFY